MSISSLRKLLEDNEEYPPSELLWRQILDLAQKKTPQAEFRSIQSRMLQEIDTYRPPLPEPNLARFFYQSQYYFLDAKNQIYRPDPANPLVGNLVGNIEPSTDDQGNPILSVTIDQKQVYQIPSIKVKERQIHDRHYYLDQSEHVYRGLHPQLKYLYQVGQLNQYGKITLV